MPEDAKGIARQYHEGYRRWLADTARITSLHNAVTFLKHNAQDWKRRWGIITMDRIAQELHHQLIE